MYTPVLALKIRTFNDITIALTIIDNNCNYHSIIDTYAIIVSVLILAVKVTIDSVFPSYVCNHGKTKLRPAMLW